jgi:hypothetical protein
MFLLGAISAGANGRLIRARAANRSEPPSRSATLPPHSPRRVFADHWFYFGSVFCSTRSAPCSVFRAALLVAFFVPFLTLRPVFLAVFLVALPASLAAFSVERPAALASSLAV